MSKPLVKGVGTAIGNTCPLCGMSVANVASSPVFGGDWVFYGKPGQRFLLREGDKPCQGDNFKHYWQRVVGEGKQIRRADFLWFKSDVSQDLGQLRMDI